MTKQNLINGLIIACALLGGMASYLAFEVYDLKGKCALQQLQAIELETDTTYCAVEDGQVTFRYKDL